jgi:hypothetical protein
MRRPSYSVTTSIVIGGVALGFAALGGNINLSAQNSVSDRSPFQLGVATHETRADSQEALQFPNANEIAAKIEAVSPTPPTRTSFMASWDNTAGGTGYLLDVSTSSSFSDYVADYHDFYVGNLTAWTVTGLEPGTTYYYRVRPNTIAGPGSYSESMTATTLPATGLIIQATFDSSITGNPNAAAIQAMINRAIAFHESLFTDPITIQIRFRYATTAPDGTPLATGRIAQSNFVFYFVPWSTYINALRADARTGNDNLANASLPGSELSANIRPAAANGRAVGLNTPAAMFANGTVGAGGPYDGIVTLNSSAPYQFNRPTGAANFDAQRATEHEMDEVIGLGSRLNAPGNDLRPQDLFSWSSHGIRNISTSGARYFSINGGAINIVNFNQNPSGDLGDWASTSCPQAHPYVQNAFLCPGQASDVMATSPEGIDLDVIGYNLATTMVTTNPATNITSSSATLNGTVDPNGLTTSVRFEYGRTTSYGSNTATLNFNGNTTRNVSIDATGLAPNTAYHFRLVGTNILGTFYGSDRTFTTFTSTGLPVAATNPGTNVASFSATLNGSVYPHGSTTIVNFQYGTTTSYGFTTPSQTKTGNRYQSVSANISGLTASTTYHCRIVATNGFGTRFGSDRTFSTLTPTGRPAVTSDPASLIASFSARLNGSLDPHGLTTTFHFQYGTTTSYGLTTAPHSETGNTFRNISANINGLTASTTYHFRTLATNSAGTALGADRSFRTLNATGPPVVLANEATNVTSSSATLHGTVDPHGLTTRIRFQYGTTNNYGFVTPAQIYSGNTYQNVTANINGLTASTTYHFRIVVANSANVFIKYGPDKIFTTP